MRALPAGRGPRLLAALGVVVTLVLVTVAIVAIEPAEVADAARESDPRWLLPALAALAAAAVLRALRWRSLFVRQTRPRARDTLAALLVGDLFNNVLPLRAGEAARLLVLHTRSRISRTEIAATIVVERLYDVAVLLLVLVAALPWLPEVTWLRSVAWIGAIVGAAALTAVVLLARFGERPLRVVLWPLRWLPFVTLERWEAAPANLARGLAGLRHTRIAGGSLLLTACAWAAGILSAWLLLQGFDLGVGPEAVLLVVVATALGMGVPSAPASLGVFEAATVVALAAFDVPLAHALSYALMLHALNFVPFVLAGLAVLASDRRVRSRLA